MTLRLTFLITFILLQSIVYAQTGPAGVGNSGGTDGQPQNVLWLDAGVGITEAGGLVSSWADQSGNGLDALQATGTLQPTYNGGNADLNGLPSLSFQDDGYLTVADNILLDDGGNFSFFIVFRTPNTNGVYGIMNKRTDHNNDQAYRFYQNNGSFITNMASNGNTSLGMGSSSNFIMSSVYDGSLGSNQYSLYLNSTSSDSNNGPASLNNEASDLTIGNFDPTDNREFPGDLSEIIIFKSSLNDAQRIITENYLSTKYGISIGVNDYFSNHDASYTQDMTGIGTVDGTAKHGIPATHSGALFIEEAGSSLNQTNEFLFAAHSGIAHATLTNTEGDDTDYMEDYATSGITSRWARDYYLEQSRNGVPDAAEIEVTLTFDFDAAGLAAPTSASDYVLLYRDAATGLFQRIFSTVTKDGNSIVCQVPSTNLLSGYYTLGTGDQIVAQTWYSYKSGNWSDASDWTLDGSVAPLFVNPSNETPDEFDNVVITNGRTISIDIDNIQIAGLEVTGRLDLLSSHGHDFTYIQGKGIIRMQGWDHDTDGTTVQIDNFPLGAVGGTNGFADRTDGGTLELYGPGILLDQPRTFKDIILNMSTAATAAVLRANYTINGDLWLKTGIFQINDNSSTTALAIDLLGDYTIESNAEQRVGSADARHDFNISGDFLNRGTAYFSQRSAQVVGSEAIDGMVDANFVSAINDQQIRLFGTTYFYRLVCDKGVDNTYMLDVQANSTSDFVLTGPANYNNGGDVTTENQNMNALAPITGTLKLGSNITVNPLNNTGNYTVGSNARLLVDGATVTKTGGSAITPYGTLEVAAGQLIVTPGSGVTLRSTGQFKISGGTATMPQFRTSILSASEVGGYEQTGGTANIGPFSPNTDFPGLGLPGSSGGIRTQYATFSLTYENNSFIMTGGTLNVFGAASLTGVQTNSSQQHGGLIFINSNPGNINVSGGTVNITTSENREHIITSRAPFYNLTINNTSTGTNARVLVTGATSGDTGLGDGVNDGGTGNDEWRTLSAQTLKILNNLTIETGTTRSTGGNEYGSYLDFCLDGTCADLEIGGDLTINDYTVLDLWSGESDNDGSAAVTFNGSSDATLYVGDITSYTDNLLDYSDPEGASVDPFGDWELPFYDLTIEKPDGITFTLTTGSTYDAGNDSDIDDGAGSKNINNYRTNLVKVVNDFALESGSVDIDIFSLRLYGDITNKGILGLDAEPFNAQIKFREESSAVTRTITTTDGAEFGNVRMNKGLGTIAFTSDVYIKRLFYRHGSIYIGTHNLKVDVMVYALTKPSSGASISDFNVEHMIITDGNASDGGLSLYVGDVNNPGDTDEELAYTNGGEDEGERAVPDFNSTVYFFPIGTGTTGSYPDSKYTPFNVRLASITDDGYITVNVVDGQLQTAGPHPLGDDVLNRYWKVSHADFTTVPKVERYRASATRDDIPDGNENSEFTGPDWSPGVILDESPYTRSAEVNDQATSSSGLRDNGNEDLQIFFFGNTGSGNPADGFDLVNANYTAGLDSKFVGAPEIYYSRQDGDWHVPNTWSDNTTDQHEGAAAADYPQVGDVVFIGGNISDGSHAIVISEDAADPDDIEVEEVTFNGGGSPLLVIQTNGDLNSVDLGIVKGEVGTSSQIVREIAVTTYTLTADIGDWSSVSSNTFQYKAHDSGSSITLPTDLDDFPNLTIAGNRSSNKNGGPIYGVELSHSINVNGDLQFRSSLDFNFQDGATETITVAGDVNIGSNNDARVTFPETGLWIFEINGDLGLLVGTSAGWGEQAELLVDENAAVEHFIKLGGDLVVEERDDGVDGASPNIDLYANTGGGGVILELTGTTDGVTNITNSGGGALYVPELYKIVMNKGNDVSASFSLNHEISLPSLSDIDAQPIEIVNGLLILNDANIDITLTDASTGNFLLPNTNNPEASSGSGGLEVAAGTVRIEGDDTGILLDGLLRVSGGTLDMAPVAGNGNNFVEISSSGNALIEISDGTMNIGGQVRRATANTTGVLSYRQTGGTVNIATRNGNAVATRGVFEVLNTGSEFTHTGGTLNFFNSNNSANVPSVRLEPTTSNTNGSVITFGNTTGNSNMGIKSAIALNRIELNGSGNPSVKIYELPLSLDSLTINADNTFDANGFGLTFLGGSLINNGTFTSNGDVFNQQTTTFNASSNQEIRGNGTTDFWRLTKSGSNSLYLVDKDITVQDNLRLEAGIFDTDENAVLVSGDVLNDARHSSAAPSGTGPGPWERIGIVMTGTERQRLLRSTSGTSYFGTLTVDNPNGIIIEDETFYTFQTDEALVLSDGVLDISSNLFVIGANASVQNAFGNSGRDDFNVNNMVQTNSTFQDYGLRKIFNNGVETDFVWPVGQGAYTPVVLDMTASLGTSGATGHITIRPSNEPHPTVNDHPNTGSNTPGEINDRLNVLQYHWIIKSENITGLTANMEMTYDDSHVLLDNTDVVHPDGPFDESNYAAARLLFNGNVWDKGYDGNSVNEAGNRIFFNSSDFMLGQGLNGGGDSQITGDYTAGLLVEDDGTTLLDVGAIPNTVPEYESRNLTGLYTSSSDWTGLNGTVNLLPDESPVGAILYIRSGDEMSINTANSRIYRTVIEEGAVLELTNDALNTRLGIVEGTGTIKLTNNVAGQAIQLPAGYYEDFFTCGGGKIEYSGSIDYEVLAGLVEVREVIFSGSGNREFSNTNLVVCEDFILNDDVEIINTFARNINVRGNVIKSDNSTAYWLPFTGGSATLTLDGSSAQEIRGDFTGPSAFYNLTIDNNAGVSIVNTAESGVSANGDVEVSNQLTLSNGLVETDADNSLRILADADILGGGDFTYVNGPLVREMRNGSDDYAFPVGTASRYGRIDLENPFDFTGIKEWTATYYYDLNPYDLFTMSANATSEGVEKASTYEYWDLDAVSPASADVRPYWDSNSDVTDLNHLRVIYWDETYNSGNGAWEVLPEVSAPTGSPTVGNLSAGPLSFSTKIVTFGTINQSITLLPVELMYFRGEKRGSGNILFWATASETENAYFEVLRSKDGRNFETIGKVEPKGGAEQMAEYNFVDRELSTGTTYYILKQVDRDGNYTNSEVIAIKYERLGNGGVELSVYPNPVTSMDFELLGEYWLPNRKLHFKIMDITGNLIKMDKLDVDANGIVQHSIHLPENLTTGIYILFASDGVNQKSIKIAIK